MTACMEAVINAGALSARGTGSLSEASLDFDAPKVRRRKKSPKPSTPKRTTVLIAMKSHGICETAGGREVTRLRREGSIGKLAKMREIRTSGNRPTALDFF